MDTRLAPPNVQSRELFDRMSSRLNTCLPGIIQSFDPETQTCTVTPAIMMKTYQDGISGVEQLPDIQNVPLYFPFASLGGFALTLPVRQGDTCLLIFAQRCIDNWHELGGVQPPETEVIGARHHDMSDAFALCCAPTLVDVLENWCEDGIALRNRDNSTTITVRDIDVTVKKGNNSITVNGNEIVSKAKNNTLTMTSEFTKLEGAPLIVTVPVDFHQPVTFKQGINTSAGIDLTTHKHPENGTGGGITGVPQ